jgi:hypothetical protein
MDEEYQKAILETVQGLARDLGSVQEKIRTDTIELLQDYRKDSHRSIMAAQMRTAEVEGALKGFRERYEEDKLTREKERKLDQQDRIDRQKNLDLILQRLQLLAACAVGIGIVILLAVLIYFILRSLLPGTG